MEEREIVALLRATVRHDTHGIVLEVSAMPGIVARLADQATRKIAVVTQVADVTAPLRLAHVGMQNSWARATATCLAGGMREAYRGISASVTV